MSTSTVPSIVIPDRFNAASAFLDRNLAEGRGAKTAIYYEGTAYTYAQIAELANRVGNGLLDLGIDLEQRVALLLLDSPQFAAAFFGAIKIGAVPVPVNTMLRPNDYVYMLNDSRARALIIHAALWQQVKQLLPQLKYLRHVVVVGPEQENVGASLVRTLSGGQVTRTPTVHDFDKWMQKASTNLEAAETSKDDSAFWLYSSGSTGFPKGCVHLQHDMTYCTEYYAKPVLGIKEDDITFSAAKLYFAYGLGNNLYFPFGVGASAVHFPGRLVPEDMFKVVEQYRPTIFYGVPTLYAGMLALSDTGKRFDFSSVRICVSAGESLPADILRRFEETFNVQILDGIGSTEILHIFISNRIGEIKPGSTGKLVPGYEALIADESGHAVPQGDIGNLLIKGDSTTAYYWNKHEKTKDVINGHWIHTGDKYYQDPEGFDADELVKPKAYVVLKAGHTPSVALSDELKAFVKERLAPYKYPRWIEFVPELPKTATGKIQRFLLRGTGQTEPLDPSVVP